MENTHNLLKQLPSIDSLIARIHADQPEYIDNAPQCLVTEAAQQAVAQLREKILRKPDVKIRIDSLVDETLQLLAKKIQPSLRQVINATGTLLHTNLGRAPLSIKAINSINEVAGSYSNLELNLSTGKRGHRYSHVDKLLCRLTGAEAAAVVNNNAAAVLLALTSLAKGKEAIVSRGELVEIGGSFRVPDVMEAGGVILREVGTTNKTHLRDYVGAINAATGLLLKVHTSNYRIVGFEQSVTAAQLVQLGQQHKIPVMEDLGSGMLFDLSAFGLPHEPTVQQGVKAGIDILTFSGDKLLGGPQAGIIVGKKWAVDIIRHHPLARAMRIDKLTLAALEATLRHYLNQQEALREIPLLRMLNADAHQLQQRSTELAQELTQRLADTATITVIAEPSCVGGGSLPTTELPGYAVALKLHNISVQNCADNLRSAAVPVIARIQDDQLIVNLRTVFPHQQATLIDTLAAICRGQK